MKKEDIVTGELIGKHAIVTLKNGHGFTGRIVDETKNMLVIRTQDKDKRIIKTECEIDIGGIKISGAEIATRPEERIKKWLRRKK